MRVVDEPLEEILLEGLARSRRSVSQGGVHVVGNVFDLNARHEPNVAPLWRSPM